MALGYKDVKDLSVYAKFKIKSGQKIGDDVVSDNTYILAWTTTPWTLPGNVALAVGNDIEYVKIEVPTNTNILTGTVIQGKEVEKTQIAGGVYILAKEAILKFSDLLIQSSNSLDYKNYIDNKISKEDF